MTEPLDTTEASKRSDTELMNRCKQGDLDSFSTLVDRHQHTLVNFLLSMSVSPCDVDDISQDVWIKIYDYRHRYTPSAKFSTFLYKVCKMKCIDVFRKRERWKHALAILKNIKVQFMGQREREQWAAQSEHHLSHRVDHCLQKVDEETRSLLILRFYENLSYQELAECLELPLGTIKSRLHKAIKTIQELS